MAAAFTVTATSGGEAQSSGSTSFTVTAVDPATVGRAPFTVNVTNPAAGVWVLRPGGWQKVNVFVRRAGEWKQL